VILGVAFLENSDDTRNTPSKTLYNIIKDNGANPILHDPHVRDFDLPFTKNLDEAIKDADALVLMVKHKDYLNFDLSEIKNKMRTPVIIDGRNAFNKKECERIGFIYNCVGKPH